MSGDPRKLESEPPPSMVNDDEDHDPHDQPTRVGELPPSVLAALKQAAPPKQAAKPAEAKPAEAKPAEAKPAEAKPAEAKPAEAKPAEMKTAPPVPKAVVAKPVAPKPGLGTSTPPSSGSVASVPPASSPISSASKPPASSTAATAPPPGLGLSLPRPSGAPAKADNAADASDVPRMEQDPSGEDSKVERIERTQVLSKPVDGPAVAELITSEDQEENAATMLNLSSEFKPKGDRAELNMGGSPPSSVPPIPATPGSIDARSSRPSAPVSPFPSPLAAMTAAKSPAAGQPLLVLGVAIAVILGLVGLFLLLRG